MISETLFEDHERGLRIELVTIKFDPIPGERKPRADRSFVLHVSGAKVALSAAQMIALSSAFRNRSDVPVRVLSVLRGEGAL